jgi:hypothetical protein
MSSSSSSSNTNEVVVGDATTTTTQCSMEASALSECLQTKRNPDAICWGDVPDVLLLDLILGTIQQQQVQLLATQDDDNDDDFVLSTTACDQAQTKTCDLARECEPCQDVTLAYAQCFNVRY